MQNLPFQLKRELIEMESKKSEKVMQQKQRDLVEQRNNYSNYVKEMYWPKVSMKKQIELEQLKNSLKNIKFVKKLEDINDPVNGKNYKPWR